MSDLSRRSLLAGVTAATATVATAATNPGPVAIVAGVAAAAAPAPIFASIEAHRAAWEAFGVACDLLEKAEDTFTPMSRNTVVKSINGLWHSAWRGREDVLQSISSDFERVRVSLRANLETIGYSKRRVFAALASLDAKETACFEAANAIFDAEDSRKAASPFGAAEREYWRVSNAEKDAFMAVITCQCSSPAETAAKAAYLLTTSTVKDCMPQPEHMMALLQSLTGGADA